MATVNILCSFINRSAKMAGFIFLIPTLLMAHERSAVVGVFKACPEISAGVVRLQRGWQVVTAIIDEIIRANAIPEYVNRK